MAVVHGVAASTWMLEAESLPKKDGSEELNLRYMASVGNGHIATVVYSPTVYMNGLYNGPQGWSHRAAIHSQHDLTLSVAGETNRNHALDIPYFLGLCITQPKHYLLDPCLGMFVTTIETTSVVIKHRTYAHQHYTQLLVTEIVVDRKQDAEAAVVTVNLTRSEIGSTVDLVLDNITESEEVERCPSRCFQTRGQTFTTESPRAQISQVFLYWTRIPDVITLDAGTKSNKWTYFTSMDANEQRAKTAFQSAALRLFEASERNDPDILLNSHLSAWADKWNQGRVDVSGNDVLSRLIHSSLYYILSSLPSTDPNQPNEQFYGLSPGGLANGANGTDYQGHVFWDMETWMYPPILMLFPGLAKDMLSYRIHGMDPAYDRARSGGYDGLRYPWESAYTGDEQTPDICVPCRENQQHITGDIALAARQYISATRDVEWLRKQNGYTFIRDMAKFWKSRPTWNQQKQAYEINGVMPPDEYAKYINNSIYTNIGARNSIHFARYAACLTDTDKFNEVGADWLNVADNLYIPFDDSRKYHPEYEGYDYTNTVNDSHIVKQADVIMLGFPLMLEMDEEVRRNDLMIYENVTDLGGPAMTWSMFSINWLELDEKDKADQMFDQSHALYTREPFNVWTEARAEIGAVNFITGMGGFLQALIFGYGGTRLHPEKLDFDPKLPRNTTSLLSTYYRPR
ncbi:protein-glucosylgalactosylhydroxylysine glucosidase-like [Haliotis asinina]|uniref:protein-glucosylgalactosylhydroxylysine glucosidase-like n=1 Tax=Haliotis asinina TaxID=109174 RepID=UPI003531F531